MQNAVGVKALVARVIKTTYKIFSAAEIVHKGLKKCFRSTPSTTKNSVQAGFSAILQLMNTLIYKRRFEYPQSKEM